MNLAVVMAHGILRLRMEAEGILIDKNMEKAIEWRFDSVLRNRGKDGLVKYAQECTWWKACTKIA